MPNTTSAAHFLLHVRPSGSDARSRCPASAVFRGRRRFLPLLQLLPALLGKVAGDRAAGFLDGTEGAYSTDAICQEKNCINPVFPAFEDLSLLEGTIWECTATSSTQAFMSFCKKAINYDVAIPSPNATHLTMQQLVNAQDNAAATAYFYHLSGMNMDPWEYKHPDSNSDLCVRSIWQMACNTYFPRAAPGCKPGEASPFLRPCSNVCTRYIDACGVNCCDESTKCVVPDKLSAVMTKPRYVNDVGPSAACTGGLYGSAARRHGFGWQATAMVVVAACIAIFTPTTGHR